MDCHDDEAKLALTFDSTDAFEHAKEQWSYVNKDEDGRFMLVANSDGCGSKDQRQAYM